MIVEWRSRKYLNRPPLWSSGQSSRLQTKKIPGSIPPATREAGGEVVGLERGIWIQVFLTSALDRYEWSASPLGRELLVPTE
jgi:hypothetical protein